MNFGVGGPLADILEPVLNDVTGTGGAVMDLELATSLYEEPAEDATGLLADLWEPLDVDGSFFVDGNDIAIDRAGLTITGARGAVGFNESCLLYTSPSPRDRG